MSENEYIVQCPACQTRFAVESDALDGFNKPKFHCSRCDQVFDAEWLSLARTAVPAEASLPQDASATFSIVRRNNTERRKIKPTREFESLEARGSISAPHENLDDEISSGQLSLELGGRRPRRTSEMDAAERDSFTENPPPAVPRVDQMRLDSDDTDYSANTIQVVSDYTPSDREFLDRGFVPSARHAHAPAPMAKEYRGTKAALFFAVPLAIVIIALGGVTAMLLSSSSFQKSFTASLYPTLERAVPRGVRIESPKLSTVQLDSGEQVLLVSGSIVNGSTDLLRSSTVEVVLFGADDSPISRTRVNIGNSLSKAVIKSLSPDIITQLQTERKPRQSPVIASGKDKEFVIALDHGRKTLPIDEMSGFTVRVSSVVL